MSRIKPLETSQPGPSITRRVEIKQPDWLRRPGEPWRYRPKPPPQPFDLRECLDRLERGFDPASWYNQGWKRCRIAPGLVPAEARFWLEAMLQARLSGRGQIKELVSRLAGLDYDAPLPPEQVVARIREELEVPTAALAIPLVNLLPLEQFLDLMVGERLVMDMNHPTVRPRGYTIPSNLLQGFAEHVLAYLTEGEAERLRAALRERSHLNGTRVIPWAVAAYLAMHAELRSKVKSWPDGAHSNGYYSGFGGGPHLIVFNAGDSHFVEQQVRRVRLWLSEPEHVAAWVLHTQWRALDHVRDSILRVGRKDKAAALAKVLVRVQAPEAAPVMLQLSLESKAPGPARQWLEENPGNTIAGLILIAGDQDKLGAAALDYLRDAKKKGHAGFIAEQLKSAPADAAARVRQEVLEHEEKVYEPHDEKTAPAWLRAALATAPTDAKPSTLAQPTRLPPLLVEGRRLSDEQVQATLSALRVSPLGSPQPLIVALKQHADRSSLDAFAWKLFELWLADGAPSKEKWALLALGHLGSDAVALKLTPLLRAWPGESQHQRAVTGLECLRAIGTGAALMQLNGIAQKLKFQGLKNKARQFMEAIAQDRRLTREQLEDRIVPDLGLDQRGTRVFDHGPRRFTVVLGPDLRPLVRDEGGQLRDDLPKPGARDDAARAGAAVAEWKVLKKALREAVKVQALRLEQTMVVGRRWTPDEFQTLLVRHPLMVNLVRRLLWGGYDAKGQLARTFRVTEEGEYADAEDRSCTLEGLASVGVVRPLHLSEQERSRWGQVFGDYEIIAPFPQLGRPVFSLAGTEAQTKEITRFAGKKIPAATLWGTLERLGWARGVPQDAGVVHEHTKSFPSAGVTGVLGYEIGIPVGFVQGWEDQRLKGVYFLESSAERSWLERNRALPLGQVDAVVLSEVLADLTFLASKAE